MFQAKSHAVAIESQAAKHEEALKGALAAAASQLNDTVSDLQRKHSDAMKSTRAEYDAELSQLRGKLERAQADVEVRSISPISGGERGLAL